MPGVGVVRLMAETNELVRHKEGDIIDMLMFLIWGFLKWGYP
jgi:hypothetical protein